MSVNEESAWGHVDLYTVASDLISQVKSHGSKLSS